MRFCFAESMCDPSQYLPLAKAAEEAGFDIFSLGDSIIYPEEAVGTYPYTEDGDRSFLDGVPMPDPFQLIAAMSAVTERIQMMTGVLKVPIRQPVLVAKQVSSLAVLTGERFVFGVGLSPWLEDFQACGEDWKTRGARMSEMLEIIRGLMDGSYFEYHGEYYDFAPLKLCPVPKAPPSIIYGGHTPAAFRRAARLADGFTHTGLSMDELEVRMSELKEMLREEGREGVPFETYAGVSDVQGPDDLRRLEDMGVDAVFLGYRNPYMPDTMTLQQKLDAIAHLGDEVISRF
ncbi:TIGR03619 family F420-dependent LLM class oxidoreductase [Myxococcota bacterium]|nr:TIGR03619 family F420-dependent LLM class oxidoreductase [Myxococcota bacterium]